MGNLAGAVSTNGVVLSDRATLRLEHGGPLDAEIAPASLYRTLQARWPELRAGAAALASTAMDRVRVSDSTRAILRRSADLDALTLVLTTAVSSARDDLVAVYLPGSTSRSGRWPAIAAAVGPAATLEAYYVVLDTLLAEAARPRARRDGHDRHRAGRNRGWRRRATRNPRRRRAPQADASPPRRPTSPPRCSTRSGSRSAATLDGQPLVSLFAESFAGRYPVRYVPAYGPPSNGVATRNGQPLDQEMIDRLRSLGYVRSVRSVGMPSEHRR